MPLSGFTSRWRLCICNPVVFEILNVMIEFRLFVTEPEGTIIPRMLEPSDDIRRINRRSWTGDHVLLPCVAQGFPVPETT